MDGFESKWRVIVAMVILVIIMTMGGGGPVGMITSVHGSVASYTVDESQMSEILPPASGWGAGLTGVDGQCDSIFTTSFDGEKLVKMTNGVETEYQLTGCQMEAHVLAQSSFDCRYVYVSCHTNGVNRFDTEILELLPLSGAQTYRQIALDSNNRVYLSATSNYIAEMGYNAAQYSSPNIIGPLCNGIATAIGSMVIDYNDNLYYHDPSVGLCMLTRDRLMAGGTLMATFMTTLPLTPVNLRIWDSRMYMEFDGESHFMRMSMDGTGQETFTFSNILKAANPDRSLSNRNGDMLVATGVQVYRVIMHQFVTTMLAGAIYHQADPIGLSIWPSVPPTVDTSFTLICTGSASGEQFFFFYFPAGMVDTVNGFIYPVETDDHIRCEPGDVTGDTRLLKPPAVRFTTLTPPSCPQFTVGPSFTFSLSDGHRSWSNSLVKVAECPVGFTSSESYSTCDPNTWTWSAYEDPTCKELWWIATFPNGAEPKMIDSRTTPDELKYTIVFPSNSARSMSTMNFEIAPGTTMDPNLMDPKVLKSVVGSRGLGTVRFRIIPAGWFFAPEFTLNWREAVPAESTEWTMAVGFWSLPRLSYQLSSNGPNRILSLDSSTAGLESILYFSLSDGASLTPLTNPYHFTSPLSKSQMTFIFTVTSSSGNSVTETVTLKVR